MKTPIYDFVKAYAKKGDLRLHMPGHKGKGEIEQYDITEIQGADSLYEANGIISESEQNAGSLFGADTFYSAEGSSLSIRAAIYLTSLYAKSYGKSPIILAARNVHKTFISAVSLLDVTVEWLYGKVGTSYLSCKITANDVEHYFKNSTLLPTALYLTSPDYLGNIPDIASISRVCKKYGVLLIVDNAHGAYLKFLPTSLHPIDLGADVCCDSAHKTLPVLTGGAYLHVSKNAPAVFKEYAKNALALFGSTSPSYLILSSLDKANAYIDGNYAKRLVEFTKNIDILKKKLIESGYTLCDSEPLKITVKAKPYGYLGYELAKILEDKGIICEFADPDFLVLMLTPEIIDTDISKLFDTLLTVEKKAPITEEYPNFFIPQAKISPREALLLPKETISTSNALGRVLGAVNVGCPPAVPILVMGELIDENSIKVFKYYGIKELTVIK